MVSSDSIDVSLHIFDANIKAAISGDSLTGVFVKNYAADYKVPFRAEHGQEFRFEQSASTQSETDFTGSYEVMFLHETDTTKAVAMFKQSGPRVTGTFLTPTGDYRFLEGSVAGNQLQLSAFDGNHLYVFRAVMKEEDKISGEFFSGKTWYETWVGVKNENATLPDSESLTYLRDGYERITFAFPDANGKLVSLEDDTFKKQSRNTSTPRHVVSQLHR